jgi:hypothetical protein
MHRKHVYPSYWQNQHGSKTALTFSLSKLSNVLQACDNCAKTGSNGPFYSCASRPTGDCANCVWHFGRGTHDNCQVVDLDKSDSDDVKFVTAKTTPKGSKLRPIQLKDEEEEEE